MIEDIPDLNAQREARDIAFERTFVKAFELADQLSELAASTNVDER